MPRKLPPLNPLKVFEAVARLQSITRASKELMVTQAAVSRQIYVLEDYLKQQLFVHQRGRITLTRDGRDYFEKIHPAFEIISGATGDLTVDQDRKILRLSTYQTVAQYWLIPRLPLFRALHPRIELHISTQVEQVGSEDSNSGLFIQFGDGKWPGFNSRKLLGDRMAPICSPAFRDRHGIGDDPTELAALPVLGSSYRRRDWADWLRAAGLEDGLVRASAFFQSTSLAYRAAEAGLGVAMGQLELIGDEIEAGRLVQLYPQSVERPQGYYLIWAKGIEPPAPMRQFIKWLSEL